MNLSPADLAKILAQPGYAIAPGSLWEPPATQQGGGATENGAGWPQGVMDDLDATKARQGLSTPSLWQSERHFQAAVIAECDRRAVLEPEYGLIFAVPNGQYRKGQRAEPGLKSGVPDLFLPVARREHGLWLELKVKDGKPSRAQLDMIHRLRMQGYRCEIVWDSLDEVMGIIEDYLRGDA